MTQFSEDGCDELLLQIDSFGVYGDLGSLLTPSHGIAVVRFLGLLDTAGREIWRLSNIGSSIVVKGKADQQRTG